MPSHIDGDSAWEELLIVCPCAEQKADVHPVLAAAASEVDADSSDGLQWLILRTNEDVRTLELSRIDFDFCSRSFTTEETFTPETQWEMREEGGTFLIVPAVWRVLGCKFSSRTMIGGDWCIQGSFRGTSCASGITT
ncbi:hypothetical protein GCM10009720_27600 [Yaniella flava]|uniref:Uncharacterized protein n=1 Tax=Yaniella flava TaxID=287930 RepID=A0ABN2V340_9MICC